MGIVDNVSLYLITDDKRSAGRPVEEIVEEAVAGGVRLVQYRPWMISDIDYVTKAMALRRITRKAGCILLLNARPNVALQVGADGVHVGHASMAIPAARRRLIDVGIIGYSAHSPEEAKKAEEDGADFITYSPIFETTSSSKPRPTLGVDAVIVDTRFPAGRNRRRTGGGLEVSRTRPRRRRLRDHGKQRRRKSHARPDRRPGKRQVI